MSTTVRSTNTKNTKRKARKGGAGRRPPVRMAKRTISKSFISRALVRSILEDLTLSDTKMIKAIAACVMD